MGFGGRRRRGEGCRLRPLAKGSDAKVDAAVPAAYVPDGSSLASNAAGTAASTLKQNKRPVPIISLAKLESGC